MAQPCYDVAVVGGGPAGCATALALRAHAADLSVVVLEASDYEQARIGESLPPAAGRILDQLELHSALRDAEPVHGTAAAWGSPHLHENDFFVSRYAAGWHLDRPRFDAALADTAQARGAQVWRRTRLRDAHWDQRQWQLSVAAGTLRARFVVDASARSATVARHRGARVVAADRLVSVTRFFDGGASDPRTVVEAFADGWWYTASLPAGHRVVACLTDADVARGLRLRETEAWSRLLAHTRHVGAYLRGAVGEGPAVVRPVESRRLEPAGGDGWLAVGDAASMVDPLSSQGITRAMRSGIFAAYAIADWLRRGERSGLERYRRFVAGEFEAYLQQRGRYYAIERRWPERAFWRRRSAA